MASVTSMFNLKKPCNNCPFRKDRLMGKSLHTDRKREIVVSLMANKSFFCHETVNYDDDDYDDETEKQYEAGNSFCAGAIILLENEGIANANQIIRIGKRLELLQELKSDVVYKTINEFIDDK